jgi:hypothetical protein
MTEGTRAQGAGILLFLFIPVVLYLFVAHPEPLWASLTAGVILMVGHRRIARPHWLRMRERKCVWCNRWLGDGGGTERVVVRAAGEAAPFAACAGHAAPALRFFAWADRMRLPLRAGIGAPLVLLILALAGAAAGAAAARERLPEATELFRLAVGLTVNLGALGPWLGRPGEGPPGAAFPLHNFSLLGVRAILWIFRLVGVWWVIAAGKFWIGRLVG